MALNGYPADILASVVFKFPKLFPKWEKLFPEDKQKAIKENLTLQHLEKRFKPTPKLRTSKERNQYLPYAQNLPPELQNRLKHILSKPLTKEQAATLLTLLNENHDINNPPKRIIDVMIKGPHAIFAKT
jgi:hypothetical protein